jgi:hypothetical protein
VSQPDAKSGLGVTFFSKASADMAPPSRMGRRRKAVVYVSNREGAVRTAMRYTASSPLYPLNVEQRWTPPPSGWELLAGANRWTPPPRLEPAEAGGEGAWSPPGSPVDSPERLASPSPAGRPTTSPSRAGSRQLMLRPSTSQSMLPPSSTSSSSFSPVTSPPSDAGGSDDGGGIGSIRRQLFQALPADTLAGRRRWRGGNDNADEPEAVRRQRRAVARARRLKRKTKSVAELVVSLLRCMAARVTRGSIICWIVGVRKSSSF